MISVDKRKGVRAVNLHLLVVICKSTYNCILDRPFVTALDGVVSPIHLKLKFHNLHDEPVTINVDLVRAKRTYQ